MKAAASFIVVVIALGLTSCGSDPVEVPPRELWIGDRAVGLVYFEKTGKVILINGGGSIDPIAPPVEIWEWTGTTWIFISDNNGPPARLDFSITYDSKREVLILYGGWMPHETFSDLWEWNGSTWNRLDASILGVRSEAGLAYDEAGERTILFGGYAPSGISLGDTWAWDGHAWTLISEEGPAPRTPSVMSYDYHAKKILMYGGYSPSSPTSKFFVHGDAWYLDSGGWRQVNDGKEDLFRLEVPAVFNFSVNKLVTMGGNSYPPGGIMNTLNQTLAWNETRWENTNIQLPASRSGGAAVYDRSRNEIVLVGGSTEVSFHSFQGNGPATWVWNGTSWKCLFGCN
jgi:hypothetical protein